MNELTEDSDIVVMKFPDEDKYLTLSLESHLIDKFKPILNKRI